MNDYGSIFNISIAGQTLQVQFSNSTSTTATTQSTLSTLQLLRLVIIIVILAAFVAAVIYLARRRKGNEEKVI
jgi:heme/copper-type cytochrome/quinol oxidase subunit 2